MGVKYSWVAGLADVAGSGVFCTALARSYANGQWQNTQGMFQLAAFTPEQFAAAVAANLASELIVAALRNRRRLRDIVFDKIRFFRWRQSDSLTDVTDPVEYWPLFLRDLEQQEVKRLLHSPRRLSEGMKKTWTHIYSQGTDLRSLDFIRLVSRADIEMISSKDFSQQVVYRAQDEVRIHLADDECQKRMTIEEIEFMKTHPDIRTFIKEYSQDVATKALVTEEHWEPRYLNNNVSILGNLIQLRKAQLDNLGKLKVFFYKGNLADNRLPTLRATLIESRQGNKVMASVMPRRATGMASSVVSFDEHFDKAQSELNALRTKEINIDQKVKSISTLISELSEDADYLMKEDRDRINRVLKELHYQGPRYVRDDVQKVRNIQTIINKAYRQYISSRGGSQAGV
jgi:hypothetical protein